MKASVGDDEAMVAMIGDGDVKFVLEHCDQDGDQKIARDEVLPMLAMWRDLVKEIKERHVSSVNLASPQGKMQPKRSMQPKLKGSRSCVLM